MEALLNDNITLAQARQLVSNYMRVDAERSSIDANRNGQWIGAAAGAVFFGVSLSDVIEQIQALGIDELIYGEQIGVNLE